MTGAGARPAPTPRRRDPERRQRILTAAAGLVAERGYHEVAMSDIGAAAGIVGSGIYRHFDGKSAVLEDPRGYGRVLRGREGAVEAIVEELEATDEEREIREVGTSIYCFRHGVLAAHLKPRHKGIGSINSPMQCMMKEVCAQCLQPHTDPQTGERSVVFSCFNQDQALDRVDFPALHERLRQQGTQEKLTAQWIDRTLRRLAMRGEVAAE